MADKEQRLTRRRFIQYSAAASAMTASAYTIALKTDKVAMAQAQPLTLDSDGPSPYHYEEVPQ